MALLIRRLPLGRPVVFARSACESCGTLLGARDMVPLLSLLVLRGRCRHCGARVALAHAAVEMACLLIAVWVAMVAEGPAEMWLGCVLGWTLLALAWIDWEHLLLPDVLTLPLILAGLGGAAVLDPDGLTLHAVGALAGYLIFRGIEIGYRRLRGRDGLGAGDAKLAAAAGAWLGVAALPTVIFLAAVSGLLMALGLRVAGRKVGGAVKLPFGLPPAAIWIIWLYGVNLGWLAGGGSIDFDIVMTLTCEGRTVYRFVNLPNLRRRSAKIGPVRIQYL